MAIPIIVSPTVQTGNQISAGATVTGLRPESRTFSLTGLMGTEIVAGDVVALWGSNDGGRTFQPLRKGNNQVVQLNLLNPEVVINDACDAYATQRVAAGAGSSLVAVGLNGESVWIGVQAWLQGGNSWGQTGVLGTSDNFNLSIIARSTEIFLSDGTQSILGNPEVLKPGSSLELYAGAGGSSWVTDGGGALALSADGQMLLRSMNVDIALIPGTAGAVQIHPRAAGAGNTSRLEFYELAASGTNFVSFRSPDALAANTQYLWPTTIANLSGRALVSDGAVGEQQLSWGPAIESGAANLTNGVSAAIAANISATSRIFVQAADVVPGAGNLTIDYRPLAADRVIGTPGSFKITAVLAAGGINVLDQSQGVQWMVLNQ